MKKLLIKFPTRARRAKFEMVLDIYLQCTSVALTDFLVTIDEDDKQMVDWATKKYHYGNVKINIVKPVSKIFAVNEGLESCYRDYDVILLASDDMIPQRLDIDKIILNDMERYFPDGDGVLWYNDGITGTKLNTIVCVDKKYYERFHYLYHQSYKSLWADNEFTEIAQELGRVQYIDNVIIQHQHPDVDARIQTDALYKHNNSFWNEDEANYKKRKASFFNLVA